VTQGKHKSLNVRITDEKKKELEKRAKASKMKLSEYVRNVLLNEKRVEDTKHVSDTLVSLVLQSLFYNDTRIQNINGLIYFGFSL